MSSPQEIFSDSVWSILSNLHTCLPGIILSYDANTNKASIQPALNKNYQSGEQSMPIIENVPLIFPSSANFSMTYPVNSGDYVLLLFSERSMDLWKSVGGQVTPQDNRKFHLSDAVAIPGLQPFSKSFPSANADDFVVNYNGSEIRITENGEVTIKTAAKVAIGSEAVELLQQISDALAGIASITITVPPGTSTPIPFPIDNSSVFTGIKAQIDSIKGTIT